MKRIVQLILLLVCFSACRSLNTAEERTSKISNPYLYHWVQSEADSTKRNLLFKRIEVDKKDHVMQQLRERLDKDRNTPYWGESIYYMFRDILGK